MRTRLRILLALAGLSLFVWYAAGVGLRGAGDVFGRIGWFLPLVLLPYALVYVVDTAAWRLAFAVRPPLSFGRLFRIRWAGEAVSNLIPSAYVGGEVVKVYLLRKHHAPVEAATASVVISKTAQTAAQILFVSIAASFFVTMTPSGADFRSALGLVGLAGAAALGFFFWLQRRGLFRSLMAVARFFRLQPGWLTRLRPTMTQSDQVMREFYSSHRPRFLGCAALYFAGWLCDTIELFVFAWLSGTPISWRHALVVEACTGMAKALGWFVPGSAGIQESGVLLAGRSLGLSGDLCVSYAVFRRSRELLYALAGWGLLALEEKGRSGWRKFQASFREDQSSTQLL